MGRILITVLGFMVVTFGVQGGSHFVLAVDHYDTISFIRPDPVLPMGFAAMIVQASIMGLVLTRLWPEGVTLKQALLVSACFGMFLASYIVLAEPAKYAAPSIGAWMATEAMASTLQFTLFGAVLWLIFRRRDSQ
ncbi:hypothetical protein [Shimia sp.]|uniref:hypothetical protein n=1 Tax=Shimia sp. TaxID=1954381 RepID=UPI0032970EB9